MSAVPSTSWRRRLLQGLAVLLPTVLGAIALRAAGFQLSPASTGGQLLIAGLTLAILAWALPALWRPPARAVAGQFGGKLGRRRWYLPLDSALPLAAACAALLWLQPAPPADAPVISQEPAVVVRTDPLRADTPDGPEPRSIVTGADTDTPAGSHPTAAAGVTWLRLSGRAWPLRTPLPDLIIAPGVPTGRLDALAKRFGSVTVGSEADGFPLPAAVADEPAAPAFPEQPRSFGVGPKALSLETLDLAGTAPPMYFWTALPYADEVRPLRPLARDTTDSFALSADRPVGPPAVSPVQRISDVGYVAPVFGVTYRDGLPVYALAARRVPGSSGFDTLGESGLQQAADTLGAAAATWRSRRHAAAAGFVIPAGDLRAAPRDFLSARALPDGRSGAEAARRRTTRRVLGAGAVVFALLGLLRLRRGQ